MKVMIIGLGTFGVSMLESFKKDSEVDVIIVDKNEQLIEKYKEGVASASILDTMDKDALQSLPIDEVDVAICSIGENMSASLITCLHLKELQVNRIIARASSKYHAQILEAIGIPKEDIVFPEEEVGKRLAGKLVNRHIINNIVLAGNHVLAEIKVKQQYVGTKLKDLKLRERYKINVVAIKFKEKSVDNEGRNIYIEKIIDVPDPDYIFTEDTVLVIVGDEEAIERFKEDY
jgi:trk system potassium uptake protein TrkA